MKTDNQRYLSHSTKDDLFSIDEYVAPTYKETPSVIRSKHTPRFGNTDDIGSLISGTRMEKRSYITGVVAISIIILLIFAIWSIVLIVLKCLGKKVGCAAGIPPKLPKKDIVDASSSSHAAHNYTDDENEERAKKIKCTILWTRIIFILCGIGNIISSSIFVHYGVNSLQNSIVDVGESLNQVDDVLYQANGVLDQFVAAGQDTIENSDSFEQELIDTTSGGSGYCFGKDDAPFRELIFQLLSQFLIPIGTGVTIEARLLQSDLSSISEITASVRDNLSTVDWMFKVALAIAIIQIIITIILVGGVILAWIQKYPKPFKCIQSYVILPFFVCMVFLSALFSCVFVCISVVGSDFCFGDPDSKVIGALEQMDFNSAAFNVMAFYIKGCIKDLVPDILKNVTNVLGQGMTAVSYTLDLIENVTKFDSGLYTQLCGTDAYVVTQVLNATDLVLHSLVNAASGVKSLLHCGNINPIYVSVAYDAICYNGVTGIRVIFSTQLCIAVFSMIMVTLRASWQEIEQEI